MKSVAAANVHSEVFNFSVFPLWSLTAVCFNHGVMFADFKERRCGASLSQETHMKRAPVKVAQSVRLLYSEFLGAHLISDEPLMSSGEI